MGMALAIYRKYRPKSFDEFFGQKEVVEIIRNAARQNRLAHAYLFYGPRGTGKTTTARLVAKLANCETRLSDNGFYQKGEPCNDCGRCKEIDSGRALDIIEIDAASNRGIDDVRALQEGIRSSPSSYDYKVVILDEVHMLSRDAFNALLKTLEEPPAHVIIILATTEIEKVPPTIASRTQRFHFRKLNIDEIVQKLQKIAAAEKMKVADDALELIAGSADGSLRDAESLLDQMASIKNQITAEDVEKIIGKAGLGRLADFSEIILENQLAAALKYIADLNAGGYNLVDFNKELIYYWRRLLSLRFDPSLVELYKQDITKKELEKIRTQSAKIVPEKHLTFVRSLIRAYSEMRYSPFVVVPLEIAIIENLKTKNSA